MLKIAGVASGCYSGAELIGEIIQVKSGVALNREQILAVYALVLILAGVINTFSETMLKALCYISFVWQIGGCLIIVIWMICSAQNLQPISFVLTGAGYQNNSGYSSVSYVVLIGFFKIFTYFQFLPQQYFPAVFN